MREPAAPRGDLLLRDLFKALARPLLFKEHFLLAQAPDGAGDSVHAAVELLKRLLEAPEVSADLRLERARLGELRIERDRSINRGNGGLEPIDEDGAPPEEQPELCVVGEARCRGREAADGLAVVRRSSERDGFEGIEERSIALTQGRPELLRLANMLARPFHRKRVKHRGELYVRLRERWIDRQRALQRRSAVAPQAALRAPCLVSLSSFARGS